MRARTRLNEFERGLLKVIQAYSPYITTFGMFSLRTVEHNVYEIRPYYSDGSYYGTYRVEDWGDKWKVRCIDRNGYTTQEFKKENVK